MDGQGSDDPEDPDGLRSDPERVRIGVRFLERSLSAGNLPKWLSIYNGIGIHNQGLCGCGMCEGWANKIDWNKSGLTGSSVTLSGMDWIDGRLYTQLIRWVLGVESCY